MMDMGPETVGLCCEECAGDEDDFGEGGYLVSPYSAVVRSLGA